MQAITQRAPCHCLWDGGHMVCACVVKGRHEIARSDASWSTIHPIMHRNLPPWLIVALSTRRRILASTGQSKTTVVIVDGFRSRPRRMARYVFKYRLLCNVRHATVLDNGHIVCACVVKGRHEMLDLTHLGRPPIPSCTETCRRG